MALEHIEYGALASSEVMNSNFEYLDNRISTVANNQSSDVSGLYSNIASMNSTLNEKDSALSTNISNVEEYAKTIRKDFDTKNDAPNYEKAVGISLPYTVGKNGYVYGGTDGIDVVQYVYVNNRIVHGHCGYSGGKWVYSGSLFRVSPGDVVRSSRASGSYFFYPMKGE